jgi:hypothetical protein
VSATLFLGIVFAFLLPFATISCDVEETTTFTGLQLATRNVPETPTELEGVVFLVSLLTLGAYQVFWPYAVNRDLNEYGKRLGPSSGLRVRPWLSVLALTLGALVIVPPFVTIWRTFRRIQRAGVLAGVERPLEPWLGLVLLLGAIVWVVPIVVLYEQGHVNDLWKHVGVGAESGGDPLPAPLPA